MASKVTIIEATGRCECRLCGKKIEMGELAIKFENYNGTAQVHSDPIKCCNREVMWKYQINK